MFNYFRNLPAEHFNQLFPPGDEFKYYPVGGVPDFVKVRTLSLAFDFQNKTIVRVTGCSAPVSIAQLEPVKQDAINTRYNIESVMRAYPENSTTHQLALKLIWQLDNTFPLKTFDLDRQKVISYHFRANQCHSIVDVFISENTDNWSATHKGYKNDK
ncbi:hypothetical protein ACBQ88_17280 [Citrobacter braakii]|uniref:hypothetical protein n=1 Tax=Citrobacter braakii TaxID=57706 RepID=UPI003525C8D3